MKNKFMLSIDYVNYFSVEYNHMLIFFSSYTYISYIKLIAKIYDSIFFGNLAKNYRTVLFKTYWNEITHFVLKMNIFLFYVDQTDVNNYESI